MECCLLFMKYTHNDKFLVIGADYVMIAAPLEKIYRSSSLHYLKLLAKIYKKAKGFLNLNVLQKKKN